jgi:retron-type reverse transcriptase
VAALHFIHAQHKDNAVSLYQDILDFDNLMRGYHAARKRKRYRPEVVKYTANLEENLLNLHNHLVHKTWQPGRAREFVVLEPKMRMIQAPPFHDRVLHHAVVDLVEPLFERRFIYHSYACRKGKGTQAGVLALQHMLRKAQRRWDSVYVVQADVSKFFDSLPHNAVLDSVASTIECPDTLGLWRAMIRGYGHDDGIGQPVGALSSQLNANATLDGVDHEMTDGHGAGQCVRYMDDIVIVCPSKATAWQRLEQLQAALERRGLSLNPKTQVRPASAGVDWCGYRIWATHILPRKRNIKRFKRRLKILQHRYAKGTASLDEVQQHLHAFLAYAKHCDSWNTVNHLVDQLTLKRDFSDVEFADCDYT